MKSWKKLFSAEVSGMGVVEMVLIIAVILGLILIFRTQVTQIVTNVFNRINTTINTII